MYIDRVHKLCDVIVIVEKKYEKDFRTHLHACHFRSSFATEREEINK